MTDVFSIGLKLWPFWVIGGLAVGFVWYSRRLGEEPDNDGDSRLEAAHYGRLDALDGDAGGGDSSD